MDTGKLIQLDADQIYAKAKEEDKDMKKQGTYPDLAMKKGLELIENGLNNYCVKSSHTSEINELKRMIHKNMFLCVNMVVTDDLYDISSSKFVYNGIGRKAGGHSLVCCGYDD